MGRVWLASLLTLILAPLINAYGLSIGAPLVSALTGATVLVALIMLFLSAPLSWGLGCVGLVLELMDRHRDERKRKIKREFPQDDRSALSIAGHRTSARPLAESREHRLASGVVDARHFYEGELGAGGLAGKLRSIR